MYLEVEYIEVESMAVEVLRDPVVGRWLSSMLMPLLRSGLLIIGKSRRKTNLQIYRRDYRSRIYRCRIYGCRRSEGLREPVVGRWLSPMCWGAGGDEDEEEGESEGEASTSNLTTPL